jgi:hypothetical protein
MINEYVLCDILCIVGYLEWMAIIFIIIYTIKESIYEQDRDTKDSK